jgi:hypothetical protein
MRTSGRRPGGLAPAIGIASSVVLFSPCGTHPGQSAPVFRNVILMIGDLSVVRGTIENTDLFRMMTGRAPYPPAASPGRKPVPTR